MVTAGARSRFGFHFMEYSFHITSKFPQKKTGLLLLIVTLSRAAYRISPLQRGFTVYIAITKNTALFVEASKPHEYYKYAVVISQLCV